MKEFLSYMANKPPDGVGFGNSIYIRKEAFSQANFWDMRRRTHCKLMRMEVWQKCLRHIAPIWIPWKSQLMNSVEELLKCSKKP